MKTNAGRASAGRSHFSVKMNQEQTDALWDAFLTRRKASSQDKSPWEGKEILVEWDEVNAGSYQLHPLVRRNLDLSRFRQPIAGAYKATLRHAKSGKPRREFIIKLPVLNGLEDRIEVVELAYQQEYNLRDRFPPGQPRVLPALMPDNRQAPLLESTHPHLEFDAPIAHPKLQKIPCVIREFISGKSLGEWAREQAGRSGEKFHGLADSGVWFDLAAALLKALSELHRERATHGFLYPENIVLRAEAFQGKRTVFDGNIVFTNAAESHRSVYLEEKTLIEPAKDFPVRRWYDSLENIYRFAAIESPWARFDLIDGSDYYSATDIYSLGVTLAYLATGNTEGTSPFDYIEKWEGGWQIVRGALIRRRYHIMKAKLLDSLIAAAEHRKRQASRAVAAGRQRKSASLKQDEHLLKSAVYEDSLRKAEVILQCVRSRRAISANHALTILQMFRPAIPHSGLSPEYSPSSAVANWRSSDFKRLISLAQAVDADPRIIHEFVARLLKEAELPSTGKIARPIPPAIQNLVGHRMRSVLERITALSGAAEVASGGVGKPPFLRVVGSRSTLVDAFLTAIGSLNQDDELIALTTTTIWNDDNFGPSSRNSSMLQLLRLRGVTVRWLLLVSTDDLFKMPVQRVLGFRCVDERKLKDLQAASGSLAGSAQPEANDAVGFYYACLDPDAYEKVLREKKTFIGFRKKNESDLYLHIAPDHNSREGTLVALSFWMYPRRGQRLLKAFKSNLRLAKPVINFERSL